MNFSAFLNRPRRRPRNRSPLPSKETKIDYEGDDEDDCDPAPSSAAATAGGKISVTSPSNRNVTSENSSCSVGPRLMMKYGTRRAAASSGIFAAGYTDKVEPRASTRSA